MSKISIYTAAKRNDFQITDASHANSMANIGIDSLLDGTWESVIRTPSSPGGEHTLSAINFCVCRGNKMYI